MASSVFRTVLSAIFRMPNKDEEEGFLLDHLECVPASEIESRAKVKGVWHPNERGCTPESGDIVTFSQDSFPGGPHVGIVDCVGKDGKINVITGDPYRSNRGNSESQNGHPVRQYLVIIPHEVRSVVWEHRVRHDPPMTPPVFYNETEKRFQENVIDLMKDLLRPSPSREKR